MMLEKINWILLKLHWLVLIGLFFLYKCMPVIGEFIKLVSRSGDSFNSITSIFAGVYFSIIILLLSLPSGTIVKSFSKKAFKDIGLKSIFETDFKRHSEPRLPSTAQINH